MESEKLGQEMYIPSHHQQQKKAVSQIKHEIKLTLAKISNWGGGSSIISPFPPILLQDDLNLKAEFKRRSMGIEFTWEEQGL